MPAVASRPHSPHTPGTQSGAAAIELAVSMLLLMMLFFAIISYGALFWAQQKLSQLAGEGGRYALASSYQGVLPEMAGVAACTHLKTLAAQDMLINSMGDASFQCTSAAPAATPCPTGIECAALNLSVDVKGWPLLNIMRALTRVFTDDSLLIPNKLFAHSLVQIAPGTTSP